MKPMLAAATDGTNLTYPLLASAKLDGVRCVIVNGCAMSRSLKPIPNRHVQHLLGRTQLNGLDGELIVGDAYGPGVYQRTVSGVMSQDGNPSATFMVFDDYLAPGGFAQRLAAAARRVAQRPPCQLVPHTILASPEALLAYEHSCLKLGYEGVMLRTTDGPYKPGRSTLKEGWLLKLKRFLDSEAEILSCAPLMHNANEATIDNLGHQERSSKQAGKVAKALLGALTVRDLKTKVEFDLGTGFDATQRQQLWAARDQLVGKLVKYKYQPVGVKDKPRFPVFLGFRDERDR